MTPRSLAKTYLRYWSRAHSGDWQMASNAPPELWKCVSSLRGVPLNMVYEALNIVAGGPAAERPIRSLLLWLADNLAAVEHCDTALTSKKPPRYFSALVEKAYAAELLVIRNKIDDSLQAHLDTFK